MVGAKSKIADIVDLSMNFLAHIYLSGSDDDVLLGNFMGDQVKGRDLSRFSNGIKKGILLHRRIDHFTDTHEVTAKTRKALHPSMGKYAGVVLDVFYDHFLAINWLAHHSDALEEFVLRTYDLIDQRSEELPEKTKYLFRFMKRQDWLNSYVQVDGIERALIGLSRRAKNGERMANSRAVLIDNYDDISKSFDQFFPLLKQECKDHLVELNDL